MTGTKGNSVHNNRGKGYGAKMRKNRCLKITSKVFYGLLIKSYYYLFIFWIRTIIDAIYGDDRRCASIVGKRVHSSFFNQWHILPSRSSKSSIQASEHSTRIVCMDWWIVMKSFEIILNITKTILKKFRKQLYDQSFGRNAADNFDINVYFWEIFQAESSNVDFWA